MINHMKRSYASTDTQSEFPDWREKWSLPNPVPLTPAFCGRMEPSPLDKSLPSHLLDPIVMVTTSECTMPGVVAEPLTNIATPTCTATPTFSTGEILTCSCYLY